MELSLIAQLLEGLLEQSGHRLVAQVVAMDDYNTSPVYDAAGDPGLLHRPPRRCLDRMSRHGVDFTLDQGSRVHVA